MLILITAYDNFGGFDILNGSLYIIGWEKYLEVVVAMVLDSVHGSNSTRRRWAQRNLKTERKFVTQYLRRGHFCNLVFLVLASMQGPTRALSCPTSDCPILPDSNLFGYGFL